MQTPERPRTRVIVVRPAVGGRVSDWEALCGDCGRLTVNGKPYKSKGAAEKAASSHDKQAHGGGAVIRTRQR